ncbi:MAG: YHYH protein [Myxococcota bacterium]
MNCSFWRDRMVAREPRLDGGFMQALRPELYAFLISTLLVAVAACGDDDSASISPDGGGINPDGGSTEELIVDGWLLNDGDDQAAILENDDGSPALVNVFDVEVTTDTVTITTDSVPDYATEMNQAILDELAARPRFDTDFPTGIDAAVGDTIEFGQDIGFANINCAGATPGAGYWAQGPSCGAPVRNVVSFPRNPQPWTSASAVTQCDSGIVAGYFINGVQMAGWSDTMSYESEGVWNNLAARLEVYDLDICGGHQNPGGYHHHQYSRCIADRLDDSGDAHSPLYGFALDGYPTYGPYHSDGELSESCWKMREYDMVEGIGTCDGLGSRTCLLNDPYDVSAGTTSAKLPGPTTAETVNSLSGVEFSASAGLYLEDYYYDSACTAQGERYLDEHNGHEHDELSYHYHITIDDSGDHTFPFVPGPTLYGETLQPCADPTSIGGGGGGGGGMGGGGMGGMGG